MWYFAWLLGFSLAALFAVVNAMRLETQDDRALSEDDGVKRDASGSAAR